MIKTIKIDLKRMNRFGREQVAKVLYEEVFSKLWDGLSYDDFFRYFFHPSLIEKVFLFRSKDHKLIGYLIFRVQEIEVAQKNYGIVRLSTCLLPNYFGKNLIHRYVFWESLKYFLRATFTNRMFVILVTANSPSSYCLLNRRTLRVFPCPEQETPDHIRQLIVQSCKQLGIPLIDTEKLLTRFKVNIKKEVMIRMQEKTREDDAYRFYIQQCPEYESGQAMITIMPINLSEGILEISHQILLIFYRLLRNRFRFLKEIPLRLKQKKYRS